MAADVAAGGGGVPKEDDEVGSWAAAVVNDAVGSDVVLGSSWVMVVCLVTVTVESLGMVRVTPESVLGADVLEGGGDDEDDGDDEEEGVEPGGALDEGDDIVLVASSVGMGAKTREGVGSSGGMVAVKVDVEVGLVVAVDDDLVVEEDVEESSPLALGHQPRWQASTEQQPAKPLEQRYHCVFVGQAVGSFIVLFFSPPVWGSLACWWIRIARQERTK